MLLVVGGHSRNLGKTAVVSGIIRKFRGRHWTAVKITQYGHGLCTRDGAACECEDGAEHAVDLTEEFEPGPTDSGRFLAAGAERSFWLRTRQGELAQAGGMLGKILAGSTHTIVESNSVVDLVRPDLFLMVLDFGCEDFKHSSARLMDRADAFLVIDRGINVPLWEEISRGVWETKPRFEIQPPHYVTAEVARFVNSRLSPPEC